MSTCMWPNCLFGWGKEPIPDSVCLAVLARWQGMQARDQAVTSLLMESHMYFFLMSLRVVLPEGWDKPWVASKMACLYAGGTQGRGWLVLVSQ